MFFGLFKKVKEKESNRFRYLYDSSRTYELNVIIDCLCSGRYTSTNKKINMPSTHLFVNIECDHCKDIFEVSFIDFIYKEDNIHYHNSHRIKAVEDKKDFTSKVRGYY